jgi:hypothetical protein
MITNSKEENKMNQLSAIEQIKAEFMERWGVDVNISLTVSRVDEEKAQQIVSEYEGEAHKHHSLDGKSTWISNYQDLPYDKPYSLTAFVKDGAK